MMLIGSAQLSYCAASTRKTRTTHSGRIILTAAARCPDSASTTRLRARGSPSAKIDKVGIVKNSELSTSLARKVPRVGPRNVLKGKGKPRRGPKTYRVAKGVLRRSYAEKDALFTASCS